MRAAPEPAWYEGITNFFGMGLGGGETPPKPPANDIRRHGLMMGGAGDEAVNPLIPKLPPAAVHPTETPQFKNWFGDSKVTDEGGKPLVMYHGTNKDFDVFNQNESKMWKGKPLHGYFFSSDPSLAGTYGRGVGQNIKPVYLSIKNPATPKQYYEFGPKKLMEMGYDGVLQPSKRIAVVFDPTKIKSSIANKGAFDPTNPNILNSLLLPSAAAGYASQENQ